MPDYVTWIRVRDKATGHEYDVREGAVDDDVHEPLKAYPPHRSPDPRPAKHRLNKDGKAYAGATKTGSTVIEEADRG